MQTPILLGTEKPATVAEVIRGEICTAVICTAGEIDPDSDTELVYACLFRPDEEAPEEGASGKLVWSQGETSRYWKFVEEDLHDGTDAVSGATIEAGREV